MFKFLGSFIVTVIFSSEVFANPVVTQLSFPDKTSESTLMFALNQRYSCKNFDTKELDEKTLSTLLWAAYGSNRSDGKRTIPTALNEQDLEIFVAKKDGVFKYDGKNHTLIQHSQKNILPLFQTQEYMQNVPVVLIYTGKNKEYASMHAGSAYQNVELFTAAHHLGSIVRGHFDKEAVAKELSLSEDNHVIISQAVGYEKE